MENDHFEESLKQEGIQKKSPKKTLSHNKNNIPGDLESTKMLERIQQLKLDLEKRFLEVYQLSENSNFDIEKYINHIRNSSPEELERLQKKQDDLLNKIMKAIPSEACIRQNPKSSEKLTQERKGKLLGARKKWIPMK